MSYSPDLPAAARRHCEAADQLYDNRHDVAGYLYGIAAECAIKAMMQESRLPTLPTEKRRDDPYYAHFPELKTLLRDSQIGRRGAVFMKFVLDDNFLGQWNTRMRYSKGTDIDRSRVDQWRQQAHQVVAAVGTT